MSENLPILLFLVPFVTAVSLPLVGARAPSWCRPLTLVAASITGALALFNLFKVVTEGPIRYAFGGWAAPLGIEWIDDGLAAIVILVLNALFLISLIYGGPISPKSHREKVVPYYTLLLLLISGLTGIVLAADLFNVFVFLEVSALTGYALVGAAGGRALVSALRYLIIGSFGASLYLLGVSHLYVATGTLNMADLAVRIPGLMSSTAIVSGLIFVFSGLAIKMALVPLHGWLPDAYHDAPDTVSPILASSVTKVALVAWLRITYSVVGANAESSHVPVLVLLDELGVIAAVAGGVLALAQRDIKRMFAYGGISHVGLILIGVSLGNAKGFAGGVFYLVNDAVMQATLFILAGATLRHYGARTLDDLGRVERRSPIMTATLIVVAISMIGLPPTGGFFGKWNIVLGALEAQNYLAVFAVVAATLLTLAYFVKLFNSLFQGTPASDVENFEAPLSLTVSLGATSLAMVALGLFSDPIVGFLVDSAVRRGF